MENPHASSETLGGSPYPGDPCRSAVECHAVSKTFAARNGPVRALASVSLSAGWGEALAISGKSGAGKSTLLSLLAGLDSPTSGTVLLAGHDLGSMSNSAVARLRREKIGLIFQDFNLLASWTAFENVEAALMHCGMDRAVRRERVDAILGSLGLEQRANHLPGELSVGQQQRVAVARTLVNRPEIIFADEPSGDVDPETAHEIHRLLLEPVRTRGATLIVATHGNFPLALADRALVLKDGTIAG